VRPPSGACAGAVARSRRTSPIAVVPRRRMAQGVSAKKSRWQCRAHGAILAVEPMPHLLLKASALILALGVVAFVVQANRAHGRDPDVAAAPLPSAFASASAKDAGVAATGTAALGARSARAPPLAPRSRRVDPSQLLEPRALDRRAFRNISPSRRARNVPARADGAVAQRLHGAAPPPRMAEAAWPRSAVSAAAPRNRAACAA
jgi:hypothetical protein